MSIDIAFYFCYNKDKKGGFDMVLIKNTPKGYYWIPEEDLDCILYAICNSISVYNYKKILLEYRSSFKNPDGVYSICFGCPDNDNEYIIVSRKFISLKEVENRLKYIALEYFYAEGGVITEYGVFEK